MEPTAMDAGQILHELTYSERLPKEALKAASAQRVEMLPLFVEEIETYLSLEPAKAPVVGRRLRAMLLCSLQV
jgi:hypothetical protein